MAWLKGIRSRGVIQVRDNIDFLGSVSGSGNEFQRTKFYVNANDGSDGDSGESWDGAKATIQAAVTAANAPRYATKNVDIYVANGTYTENVSITRAGTGLTSTAMLWTGGGSNIGYIGTLRLIGTGGQGTGGGIYWGGVVGQTSPAPTLYIGRPNVEIHNFATIKSNDAGTTTAGNWGDGVEMSGDFHVGMPTILIEDNYNNDNLLGGAANNVLIKNCRVNGGGARGAIMNLGANWIFLEDVFMEYGAEFGYCPKGSPKGSPSELFTTGCTFHQNTAADILHSANIIHLVKDCDFKSNSSTTTKHLIRVGEGEAASQLCTIAGGTCADDTTGEFVDSSNGGWTLAGMNFSAATPFVGNADLAS